MRGPSSFKSELAVYRQQVTLNPAPVHVGNRWRYEFTMVVLDRLERQVTEKTWNKIKPNLSVPCANFIAAIIQCAIPAEGQARVREQTPAVEDEIRNLAKRFVNAKSDEIDERLGVAIGVLAEFRSLRERVPLREKTAPRNRFMASLRTWFQEVCGKPHDNVVAMLTNVVFDLQEPPEKGDPPLSPERIKVSGEAVRSAARNARDRERRTRGSRDRATHAQNIG